MRYTILNMMYYIICLCDYIDIAIGPLHVYHCIFLLPDLVLNAYTYIFILQFAGLKYRVFRLENRAFSTNIKCIE